MNFKELLKKGKEEKKGGGAKVSNPVDILSGEVIIDQFGFHTQKYEGDPLAQFIVSTDGTFDPSITMVDLVINGVEYFNIPVIKYIEDESVVDFIINFDIEAGIPNFNVAPLSLYIAEFTYDPTSNFITVFTEEEMDVILTVKRSSGKRIMKLHGASRTYSHTAEPRNVKFAGGVKDWPIKFEAETKTYDVTLVDDGYISGLEFDLDPTNMSSWKVSVNGYELKWYQDPGAAYFCDENDELYEFGYYADGDGDTPGYWLWAYENGTYKLDIVIEQKVVDPTFAEAVEMVTQIPEIEEGDAGKAIVVNETEDGFVFGDAGGVPYPEDAEYQKYYALTGDRFGGLPRWGEIPQPYAPEISEDGSYVVQSHSGTKTYKKMFEELPQVWSDNELVMLVWDNTNKCFRFKRWPVIPQTDAIPYTTPTGSVFLELPSAVGEYKLKATQSGSVLVYSWELIS